ncbi:unnamed protein product, partial [Ixodes persulcatus]
MKRSAVAVVDSSGKLPNGVMSGTAVSLGHFDQCLDIEAGDAFRGQFCNLELWLRDLPRPSAKAQDVIPDGDSALSFFYDNGYWLKLFPMRMGICIPSACSADDLQRMATQDESPPKKTRPSVKKCIQKHEQSGEHHSLTRDLLKDPNELRRYLRMTPEVFQRLPDRI